MQVQHSHNHCVLQYDNLVATDYVAHTTVDDNTVPVVIEHTACLHSLKTEKDCTTRIEGEIEVVTLIDKQVVYAILQLAGSAILPIWHALFLIWQTTCTLSTKGAKIHSLT